MVDCASSCRQPAIALQQQQNLDMASNIPSQPTCFGGKLVTVGSQGKRKAVSSRGRLMERLAMVFNNNLWQWLSVPLQEQLGISTNSWI
ncbi:hypothetical protein SDJN02_01916, partial [Cucurbita argyrosperma subsp. argyrosperma]